MARRRSERIQALQAVIPTEPRANASKKRKAVAAALSPATAKKKTRRSATASAATQVNRAKDQTQLDADNARLPRLPPEVLELVFDYVHDVPTVGRLSRVCKHFHSIMTPRLHKRIDVTLGHHTQLPKLIKSIQPYLSIAQNMMLEREGMYKCQLVQFPPGVPVEAKPPCAGYCREMIIGTISSNGKSEYIAYRYVEEAVEAMPGLEIVELGRMTSSLAQRVAALKNLKALSLLTDTARDDDDITPLAKIKNLQHFKIRAPRFRHIKQDYIDVTQSILLNSRLTLQSLAVSANHWPYNFFRGWNREVGPRTQGPDFPALKSLYLVGIDLHEPDFVRTFQRSINFMGLRSLTIKELKYGRRELYHYLTNLIAATPNADIKLKSFTMDYSPRIYPYETEDAMDLTCRFLGSFDTLTSLHIMEYDVHSVGWPDELQQAILKHRNMTKLSLESCQHRHNQRYHKCDTHLSLEALITILDSLPLLEEFSFVAKDSEMIQVTGALARGKNLKTITWKPSEWTQQNEQFVVHLIHAILSREADDCTEKTCFRWETHSKLRRVAIFQRESYEIAEFGKPLKNMKYSYPQRITNSLYKEREVWYRRVSSPWNPGYAPNNTDWVDEVASDMS